MNGLCRKCLRWTVVVITMLLIQVNSAVSQQQLSIPRVELMPNLPAPYLMRDWQNVAVAYDDFVFDFGLSGHYLPLIFWRSQPVNYPGHPSFGLHTVVGTTAPSSGEAINVLPAVIGATLAGIDKSSQNGYNWVLMCEEFFNRRPEENVYLNHPSAASGSDWWYDTMPNVFFYQLYDLYPHTGDFDYQFTTVADRWLEAVAAMGGSTTPWTKPYMNYRGWYLSSMTANSYGVRQPEAAGAIAWLLYNAFRETGLEKFRIGAEWAMEFLSGWSSNPAYELQLPYGVYTAARMNAELGTRYNVYKLLNWCFTPDGNVRNWGVTLGKWGGYDCYGLVGEALYDGYAFTMNGFEQVGALVPMVRYDERFARAIGKWVLNIANASRLFYPDYLPDGNQDSEWWAHLYDTTSVIAHESMREIWNGISPYATGDAISGGWGETNLALYGSSHVGIFGGIIDTTNIPGILQLDVLRTDYFRDPAYPTYLYYNPDSIQTRLVEIDAGSGSYDLYDAAANAFLNTGVSGVSAFTIPPDEAVLLVVLPSAGMVSYHLDEMRVNGIIADYHSDRMVLNYPPRIKSLASDSQLVVFGQTINIYCTAEDRDGDTLNYLWSADGGAFSGSGNQVRWTAPVIEDTFTVQVVVKDTPGQSATAVLKITVTESINHPPEIAKISAYPRKIDLQDTTLLVCLASDPDQDSLDYNWSAVYGTMIDSGDTSRWIAPDSAGNYSLVCRVSDGRGGSARDSILVSVRDFSANPGGRLVAYYPFNGNAHDESGNNHHGTVHGAALVPDRLGNPASAYAFDGLNDFIEIPNDDSLNFRQAVSINFWMKIGAFYNRESYPISHGNWERRWKISLQPERNLRWTINTTGGIKDLDTGTLLETGRYYNITTVYSGSDFEIYIDGELDVFSDWSGELLATTVNMTIGQVLPNNSNYNFNGILDEIRLYDYPLSVQEIRDLYLGISGVKNVPLQKTTAFVLLQNYPNPFNTATTITFSVPRRTRTSLKIFDVTGREVATLLNREIPPGEYQFHWEASGIPSGVYFYRLQAERYSETKKLLLLK